MRVIYKYEIEKSGFSRIEMSEMAIILDAMVIDDKLFIWAENCPEVHKKIVERTFFIVNTGEQYSPMIDEKEDWDKFRIYDHIRTVRFSSGIIKHLFECKAPEQ